MNVVPNFEPDWKRTVDATRKPFRIYADLSKLGVMPDDVKTANDKIVLKEILEGSWDTSSCYSFPVGFKLGYMKDKKGYRVKMC